MKEFFKSKTKTIIAVSLAFVLLVGSLAYLSNDFRFNKNIETPVQAGESYVYDDNGNIMESGKVYPLSSKLIFAGAAPLAEPSGVTVKAVIIPENATNKKVDWSVAWLNPLSSWASGKTASGYVTVIPTSDGSLTATVKCLQAFGEKIQIIVTSRDNASMKAMCTADYMQRATGLKGEFTGSGLGDKSFTFSDTSIPSINFLLNHNWFYYLHDFMRDAGYTDEELNSGNWTDFDYANFVLSDLSKVVPGCNVKRPKYTATSVAYTLEDTFDIEVWLYPSEGYKEYCRSLGYYPDYVGQGLDVNDYFFPEEYSAFFLFRYGIPNNVNLLRTLLSDCQNLGIPQLQFDVTVTGTYSSFSKRYPAYVDVSSLKYPVTGLMLDTGLLSY